MSPRQWRILIVGGGSIGRRHIANWLALGQKTLGLVEPDAETRAHACSEFGLQGWAGLEAGLAWAPEVVLVANPTSEHLETALAAVRQGCHLFIEKPLSDRLEGVDELVQLVQAQRLVSLIGCNMRFHPGPRLLRQALDEGRIGRPLSARLDVGSYLPSWRPGTDYRRSYSARRSMGGGCLLDAIHELDAACWYFGFPSEVMAMARPGTSLGIETEESVEVILRFADDLIVSVHLDYVQRWRQRRGEIIGERATALWDARRGEVLIGGPEGEPQRIGYEAGYDANAMYLDELRHLLNALEGREPSCADAAWAARVTRVALAAKESAERRQPVALSWEPSPVSG